MTSPPALLIAGTCSASLAAVIERQLGGTRFAPVTVERFPDGEVSVRLEESVRGREVIVLAATAPPVNDHLVELLALADACRRANAERIVAMMPYFGYARSDRRDGRRTPIMARLVAELLERAGIDHVITLDVHTPAMEGFFRIPVDDLTAVPTLAASLTGRGSLEDAGTIVVAPDLGAVRLANRYANALKLPVAVCHKRRLDAAAVAVTKITGDVADRHCIIVDDMISTGGTIAESVRALNAAGACHDHVVAATHAVLVAGAVEKLAQAGVGELLVTDSVDRGCPPAAPLNMNVISVAPLLAAAILLLREGGSLRDLS